MTPKKETKKSSQVLSAPIRWDIPDYIITRFASNMIIQNIEDDFKISFFEIKPPIVLGPSDPRPKEVRAECVASIIVTPERLPKFIEALQKHLDKYNSIKKAQ